jgi:hypothetical protein
MRILAIVCCLSLAACATPYQDSGFTGGVRSTRIDETTLQVSARGNAYTSSATIGQYVLRKAAETTLAAGYGHFQIVDSRDTSRSGVFVTPGTASTTTNMSAYGMGNTAYGSATSTTTYSPGSVTNFVKPGELVTVRMFKGPKPAGAPGGVYDAAEVVKFMTPPPKG